MTFERWFREWAPGQYESVWLPWKLILWLTFLMVLLPLALVSGLFNRRAWSAWVYSTVTAVLDLRNTYWFKWWVLWAFFFWLGLHTGHR